MRNGIDRHHQLYDAGLGETVLVKFPSGDYEFIVNHEAELGYFYTCSLVSDTHVFENQGGCRLSGGSMFKTGI
ncbi:[NiFe]-hydrogenase assembly chaperone HybE [Thiomicrorhabdus sp.]|uniref:[NiFe]-hydrogenase assembly chaperone HybE n=1 Tax=Thiomicrorhabdus sp. TaxID=2039724 RepID=UPI0029C6F5CE|nr:[NiFe]-hydrogenase assembly chaperone HybE [Thiomicrorhabdus sp.]